MAVPTTEELRYWRAQTILITGAGLGEAETLDQLRALEELKAATAAAQARLTAHLHTTRVGREAAAGIPAAKRAAGLGAEVALARRVSPHAGNRHLGVALALTREMPHTLAALTTGQISEWAATVLVRETAVLSAGHRAEVDRLLLHPVTGQYPGSGWGDRQLANEARRAGYRLDPGSAVRRVRGAETDRRVTLRPAPDTMAYLTALVPVAQGVAAYAALTRAAGTAHADGDPRSRGQIMADTLIERLTGQTKATGTPVEVELIITDQTLFNGSNEPGHLLGYGPIPAELSRRLVDAADRAWLRRLYTHPQTGALVAMDSRRRRFEGQRRHQLILTNDVCATPWCDAPARHADHPTPVKNGGTTTASNGVGLCEACNYTKDHPGWDAILHTRPDGTKILDLTSPTRGHHRSRPPDPPGAPDPLTQLLKRVLIA
jgi:hypothetical protein